MGFGGLVDFIQEQAIYLLFLGLIVVVLITGFRQAWIAMGLSVLGFAVIAIFITTPSIIQDLGEQISGLLNLS